MNGNGGQVWRAIGLTVAVIGMAGAGASYMANLQSQIAASNEAISNLRELTNQNRRDNNAWHKQENELDVRVQGQLQDITRYLHAEIVDVQKECRDLIRHPAPP